MAENNPHGECDLSDKISRLSRLLSLFLSMERGPLANVSAAKPVVTSAICSVGGRGSHSALVSRRCDSI